MEHAHRGTTTSICDVCAPGVQQLHTRGGAEHSKRHPPLWVVRQVRERDCVLDLRAIGQPLHQRPRSLPVALRCRVPLPLLLLLLLSCTSRCVRVAAPHVQVRIRACVSRGCHALG